MANHPTLCMAGHPPKLLGRPERDQPALVGLSQGSREVASDGCTLMGTNQPCLFSTWRHQSTGWALSLPPTRITVVIRAGDATRCSHHWNLGRDLFHSFFQWLDSGLTS